MLRRFAWWVSLCGHPLVMVVVLVLVPSLRRSSLDALRSVLLVVVLVVLPVVVLMVRQVRRGAWSNADASRASERPVLFVVSLAGMGVVIGWLLLTNPRSFLVREMLTIGVFLLVASVLTRWIKLSLHAAFATMTAITLTVMGSLVGYALLPVVLLVCWSRLALGRHTMHELVLGLVLGGVCAVALVAR